jgi:hypothetical protein
MSEGIWRVGGGEGRSTTVKEYTETYSVELRHEYPDRLCSHFVGSCAACTWHGLDTLAECRLLQIFMLQTHVEINYIIQLLRHTRWQS